MNRQPHAHQPRITRPRRLRPPLVVRLMQSPPDRAIDDIKGTFAAMVLIFLLFIAASLQEPAVRPIQRAAAPTPVPTAFHMGPVR